MFLELDKKNTSALVAIDDSGFQLTYGNLLESVDEFFKFIRTRSLIFILSENSIGSLVGYVSSMNNNVVPLLVSANIDKGLLNKLIDIYGPEYLWVPKIVAADFDFEQCYRKSNYVLLKTKLSSPKLHPQLSLLLSTSGSTGSPKLVRHSYSNISESAKNVAQMFELKSSDRAIVSVPINYTMGLSVVNSHLFSGATLLLTKRNLNDRNFWKFIKLHKATSFTGVPYSFEFLDKVGFFKMDLPDLKIISQGGGKLDAGLFKKFAEFAVKTNKKFFATYGQTEGTGRMTYLKPDKAIEKIGSIGKTIPQGHIELIDQEGNVLTDKIAEGELIYSGPNVTLGYAEDTDDLCKGDENNGVLKTGDIVRRDSKGYYFIIGRKNRFIKIFGSRICLDSVEQMINTHFEEDSVCMGSDEKLIIYISKIKLLDEVAEFIRVKTKLYHNTIQVLSKEFIPRNEMGKILYTRFIKI